MKKDVFSNFVLKMGASPQWRIHQLTYENKFFDNLMYDTTVWLCVAGRTTGVEFWCHSL